MKKVNFSWTFSFVFFFVKFSIYLNRRIRLLHDPAYSGGVARLPSQRCPIPGTTTVTTIEPSSEFARSSVCRRIRTGGRRWTTDVKGSAVIASTWSRQAPTATRTKPKGRSSIRWPPSAITVTSHEPGRPLFPTTQTASLKRAWSASTTAYGSMFGPSWGRNSRHARTFSRPGRGSTLKSSSWPTSKMPLPLPSTSRRASHAIARYQKTLQYVPTPHGLRLWDRALPVNERHVTPSGKHPGL